MIDVTSFSGQPVAVMGLGRSGLSAARALGRGGADVWAWDDLESSRDAAQAEGISLVDLHSCDWNGLNSLVLSPGIPDRYPEPHPIAQLAHDNDCEIICDVDLLARANTLASYVGITGTNGKSTTTALIGHILKSAGRAVEVGGNFGIPVLELASLGADGTYVIELSSYQLERVPNISLDVAVLLNISSDHLDRHGGMDGYVAAKKSIFDHTGDGAGAVIGMEDGNCRGISLDLMLKGGRQLVPISSASRVAGGVYVEDGMLIDDSNNGQAGVLDLKTVGALPGRHNWQNAAAAAAAARLAGVEIDQIANAIRSFPGLAHRLEKIGEIGQVVYVNDSKATNSEAVAKALDCYDSIYWIAGGQFKEDNLDALTPGLPRIEKAYLIGDAQDQFSALLAGKVEIQLAGDLETAVAAAHADAQADAQTANQVCVVLLSPACASFDQFENFEVRGDAFRSLVGDLA